MITLNQKWKALWNNTRYFIITGGRGSSKSFAVGTFASMLAFEAEQKVLFTRQTMTSAHLSIIPEFKEKIELMGLDDKFEILKTEITNSLSKSQILFRGIKTSSGDQTANLKSLQGVTCWIVDEAEELSDESTFDKINLSIRSPKAQNRIILILNPATKEHWIYKRFFEGMGVEPGFNGIKGDVTYIHTTYQDNIENLPKSFLDEIERIKETNPNKFKHTIEGGWLEKQEGVVFTNWKFGKFNPDGLQESFGMDFGFAVDPDALVRVAIDKTKRIIYVKQEIYQKGIKTHELAKLMKGIVNDGLVIADSAEPRLIEDLKYAGINIEGVKKGTIESGIVRMQDYSIVVDEQSQDIAKELNNFVYLNKASKLYVDDWNHSIDAIRYNVTFHLDNPNKGDYFIH